MSYSYPAANPAIRLLEFSAEDFSLVDMRTYSASLRAANAHGKADWELEYSFAEALLGGGRGGGDGITPTALAALVQRMASPDSAEWRLYRGAANGTLWCKGWQAGQLKADSLCQQGCQGACKRGWLRVLNGTGIGPAPPSPPPTPTDATANEARGV